MLELDTPFNFSIMNGKGKTKKSKRFIILYYEILWDLGLEIDEYIVLDSMLYYQKSNLYKRGIMFLSRLVSFNRNKVYKCIKSLILKGFLEKEGPTYLLHPDIAIRMSMKEGNYCIIYNDWNEMEKIEIRHYVTLYQIYSLGLKSKNRIAFIGKDHFSRHCEIGKRNLYSTLEKLLKNNRVIRIGLNRYKLTDLSYNWFEERRTCSNNA